MNIIPPAPADIPATQPEARGVEGMVLVPVEPTEAMLEAGKVAHREAEVRCEQEAHLGAKGMMWRMNRAAHVYAAMLAAAPAAPGAAPSGVRVDEDAAARKLYADYSGNHPTIHCNRFPAWQELTDADKQEWRDKVASKGGE